MADNFSNDNNVNTQPEADNNENVFITSLESFCSSDVVSEPDTSKVKTVLPSAVRLILMLLSFIVFCYSVFSIFYRVADGKKQEDLYTSIRPKNAPSAVERPKKLNEPNIMPTLLQKLQINGEINEYVNNEHNSELTPEDYRKAIAGVYSVNQDVYGWIVVTGTKIDYPIMLGEDNDYYLYRNYLHEETKAGSIFADMSLSPNHKDNYNALIYGHDMYNGSMFRGIRDWFLSEQMKTLADNMEIQIYTSEALYVYKIFSAYRSSDFNFTKTYFKDKEEYKQFLDSIYARSILNKKFKYNADETRICTLITCTNVYANPDERYVVHGILTKIVPYS
jgi:sortase B